MDRHWMIAALLATLALGLQGAHAQVAAAPNSTAVKKTLAPAAALIGDPEAPVASPLAAVYATNDARPRGFPVVTSTGTGGNGHAQTWDGRVFIRNVSFARNVNTPSARSWEQWNVTTFRPENITRLPNGDIEFKRNDSVTGRVKEARGSMNPKSVLYRYDTIYNGVRVEPPSGKPYINWLAIVPDHKVSGANPFWSSELGVPDAAGLYKTYQAIAYYTIYQSSQDPQDPYPNTQMASSPLKIVVRNPETPDAEVVSAAFEGNQNILRTTGTGFGFRCIEPSVTMDGRLIVCHGDPETPASLGKIVYSFNPNPNEVDGWSPLKSISKIYDQRDQVVNGVKLFKRYPIAEFPLKDELGNRIGTNDFVRGAYPWISPDGSEIIYASLLDEALLSGDGNARTMAVVGRWTGGMVRNIDGPINPNRKTTQRAIVSSAGAFTTMWAPYKNTDDLKLPYSVRGPSYPVFTANGGGFYSEVDFNGFLDGNYVLHYGMNELLDFKQKSARTSLVMSLDKQKTPDTSGNFNYGVLRGAKFPLEAKGKDELIGRYGQAVYFRDNSYIDVQKKNGWNSFQTGLSVEAWVKVNTWPHQASGQVPLFEMGKAVKLGFNQQKMLIAKFSQNDQIGAEIISSDPVVLGSDWAHVAMTLDFSARFMTVYVNGQKVAQRSLPRDFGSLAEIGPTDQVFIGPKGVSGIDLILDEFKLSNVSRSGWEVAYSANLSPKYSPQNEALIPAHLRQARFNAIGPKIYQGVAATLGRELFSDKALSRNNVTSCASCHMSSMAFTDGLAVSVSKEPKGQDGIRNAPMLQNRLFSTFQGWSGSANTLLDQPLVPMAAGHELNLPMDELVMKLRLDKNYSERFKGVFGRLPTKDTILFALNSFMAGQFSPKTAVDDFLAGNRNALTAAEQRGLNLFNDKARCVACHSGVNFTDESFRRTLLSAPTTDVGRAEVSGRERDRHHFKVPSLRSLNLTAPYMHDGSFKSLTSVVEAYNKGGSGKSGDIDIRPLGLTRAEMDDLVAFLNKL